MSKEMRDNIIKFSIIGVLVVAFIIVFCLSLRDINAMKNTPPQTPPSGEVPDPPDTPDNPAQRYYLRVDASGAENATGEYVLFGSYPQSKVTDGVLSSALDDKAGELPTASASGNWTAYTYLLNGDLTDYMWYVDVEENGAKYRGVYFTSYRPFTPGQEGITDWSYQGDNGYNTNTTYWFKYEPIKWKITSETSEKLTLACEMILDAQQYNYSLRGEGGVDGSGTETYATSSIKTWLNADFYNCAFNINEKTGISITTVDNGANTTESATNGNVCDDTQDNVYLLSYSDVSSASFASSRQKKGTDYAFCQGLATDLEGEYAGYGAWFTRSLSSDSIESASAVDGVGSITHNDVYTTSVGVVPAMTILV